MDKRILIEKMISNIKEVPQQAEIISLRQYSLEEIERRARRFLNETSETYNLKLDRSDWVVQHDRTLIRMPLGSRAVIYHASGAMKFLTGLNPMESLFKKVEDREALVKLVKETANTLNIHKWVERNESLNFERLWQIKVAAANQEGKTVDPVLCRVVGAYRHFVGEIPVWGAASVAIKLAGEGTLDALSIQTHETTGEVIDRLEILRPEQAVDQILLQLPNLMSRSKIPISEIATPRWLRFGYLSLTKRKVQRLLVPAYIAAIKIEGQEESQASLFAVSASEKTYLPLCPIGSDVSFPSLRKIARVGCISEASYPSIRQ